MEWTPETIEAAGKVIVSIIAAIGAIVGTVASVVSLKNRKDLHIAHDRIRGIKGEPLQYRHLDLVKCKCPSLRAALDGICPECGGVR